jgi:hypothetical protein
MMVVRSVWRKAGWSAVWRALTKADWRVLRLEPVLAALKVWKLAANWAASKVLQLAVMMVCLLVAVLVGKMA